MPKLHISAFPRDRRRHGGVRRSQQLCEIARKNGSEFIFCNCTWKQACLVLFKSPFSFFRVVPIAVSLGWNYFSFRGCIVALVYGGWIHAELRKRSWPELSLEIAPGRLIPIANVLVSLKVPFQAFPHNLEFMVPGQKLRHVRPSDNGFAAEMRVYRHADAVHTISKFDAVVLQALGVKNSNPMPYCPSNEDAVALKNIRLQRETSKKDCVLILGSVGNPPTREGIRKLLSQIGSSNSCHSFILAGFETEVFQGSAPKNVKVLGSISDDELHKLLVTCETLLVYQPPTSGMLTRLIEATAANIPTYVIGGYLQADELHAYGVQSIECIDELPWQSAL